jgi:hypothetical protein
VSEATQRDIEEAVRALVERGLARATRLLTHHRAALDEGVRRLLAAETLTAEQLPAVAPVPLEAPTGDGATPLGAAVTTPAEDGARAPHSVGQRHRA